MSSGAFQQQIPEVVEEIARPLTLPLMRFLWGWTKRMLPWLAAFSLIMIGYDYFIQWRDRPISFLLGPPGGEAANQADKLRGEFKKWTLFGPNYSITPIHTEGFQDNVSRISGDLEGNIVGFGMDGLKEGSAGSVKTILPLDWYYLHFLFRDDALSNVGISIPEVNDKGVVPPVKFSDLAAKMRATIKSIEPTQLGVKPQILLYLGPRGSGTRSVVSILLDYATIPSEEVEAVGIADFQEMVVALRQGKIDGAFFVTSLGSATVERAAKEARCTLISIDAADYLANSIPYLEKCSIPTNSYSCGDGEHPLGDVDTLAVRRVLVAPASTDAGDAYQIAQHVRTAFPSHVSKPLDEDQQFPGPGKRSAANLTRLKFDLHPGALLSSVKDSPPSWLDRHAYWLAPLLFAMIVSFIGAWKTDVAKWLQRHLPDGPAQQDAGSGEPSPKAPEPGAVHAANGKAPGDKADTKSDAAKMPLEYAEIDSQINVVLSDMHHAADVLFPLGEIPTKSSLEHWKREIGRVYALIYSARHASKLTNAQSLELKQRAFKLQQELEFLRKPPWQTVAPKSRRKPKSAPAGDYEIGKQPGEGGGSV